MVRLSPNIPEKKRLASRSSMRKLSVRSSGDLKGRISEASNLVMRRLMIQDTIQSPESGNLYIDTKVLPNNETVHHAPTSSITKSNRPNSPPEANKFAKKSQSVPRLSLTQKSGAGMINDSDSNS